METKDFMLAIDVGTSKVIGALGRVDANERMEVIDVMKVKSSGVKRGVIIDIEEVAENIADILGSFQQQLKDDEDIVSVITNVSGDGLRFLEKKLTIPVQRTVTINKIKELEKQCELDLSDKEEKIVQAFPIYYKTDEKEKVEDPIGEVTSNLEGCYQVLTMRKAPMQQLKRAFDMTGIESPKTVVGAIASADAVLTDEEKQKGVVVVDIGAGTTEMAIYLDGVLKNVKVIPFGGESITNDIKTCYDIWKKYAEQLKTQFGEAVADKINPENNKDIAVKVNNKEKLIPLKDLVRVMEARLHEIFDVVLMEIKNLQLHSKLKAGVVLTGGTAYLKNLDFLVHKKMGLDVRIGVPSSALNIVFCNDLTISSSSTCVGLLLEGLRYSEQEDKKGHESKGEAREGLKKLFKGFWSAVKTFDVNNDKYKK